MIKVAGYMMYLTPNERHIWRAILAQVENVGEKYRIGLPEDRNETCSKLGIKKGYLSMCPPMISRLIESSFILCISQANKHGMETYKFLVDPSQIKIINIKVRLTKKCSHELFQIIRTVEKGNFEEPIISWIKTQGIKGLVPISVNAKLSRYYPDRTSDGWGIIKYVPESGKYLFCVTGFERFRFVTSTRATPGKRLSGLGKRRKTKKVSRSTGSTSSPQAGTGQAAKKKTLAIKIPTDKKIMDISLLAGTLVKLHNGKLHLKDFKEKDLINLSFLLKTWSDSAQKERERRDKLKEIDKELSEIENKKKALLSKKKSLKNKE